MVQKLIKAPLLLLPGHGLRTAGGAPASPGTKPEHGGEERESQSANVCPLPAGTSYTQPLRHIKEPHRIKHEETAQYAEEQCRETENRDSPRIRGLSHIKIPFRPYRLSGLKRL